MGVKILLVDDHRIVREGLRTLLEKEPGIEVVGEADAGWEAIRLAQEYLPDIIIMDVGMRDLNGIEATRLILKEFPKVKVIALSMHSDRRFVEEMLKVGASGYLLKDNAFEDLLKAIHVVLKNQIFMSPQLSSLIIKDYLRQLSGPAGSAYSILTIREREVLQLLAEGKNTKQIASKLFVSIKTIETHRDNIMKKLNMTSIAELTKYAIREGLTPLEA